MFFSAFSTCEIHLLSLLSARKVLIQKKLLHNRFFIKKNVLMYLCGVYMQYVSMKLFVNMLMHEAKS